MVLKNKLKNQTKKEVASASVFARLAGKFSLKSRAKYSLIIGDEGAILIYTEGKEVKGRNFIASASMENLKEFAIILARRPKVPLTLIVDSMDQSFIQQSLPPISSLGVKKLIQRRLERDLGKDTIKGFVLLEREDSGRRDWNFLMVSLEKSPQFSVWLDFIDKIENRLEGIYLLSVEAENIIRELDAAMGIPQKSLKKSKKGEVITPKSKWKFFISNNKVGGFRQVVLKDGRIIFTRLGQAVGDVTPEVIAGNIEQEMSSTIEYMKRLSFNPQQGLDIYVIASAEVNAALDLSKTQAKKTYKFTPFEVAEFLKIKGAAQATDQFGDVVLSVAITTSRKHRLMLSIPQSAKVNLLYNIIVYERIIAIVVIVGMLGYGVFEGIGLINSYSKLATLNQAKDAQQKKLDDIAFNIKKGGVDVTKINETLGLYKQLTSENNSLLPVMVALRAAIIPPVSVREIVWESKEVANTVPATPADPNVQPTVNNEIITLSLHFPEVLTTDETFSIVARKVLKDVRAILPDYKAVYIKLPEALKKRNKGGKIGFDSGDPIKIEKTDLDATISITKNSSQTPEPTMNQ